MSTGNPSSPQAVHPVPPPPQASPSLAKKDQARKSIRMVRILGLALMLLFFSPFVSCGNTQYSGFEAVQESFDMQQRLDVGEYVTGISLALFPIAGIVGLLLGSTASRRIERGESIQSQGSFITLAALATAWPIFEAIRIVISSEGVWQLEWGFYLSVIAVVGMLLGASRMRRALD